MNTDQFYRFVSESLNFYYFPQTIMKKRHLKAAKRKRVLKKWLNRFGPDVNLKEIVLGDNPLLDLLDDSSANVWHSSKPIEFPEI